MALQLTRLPDWDQRLHALIDDRGAVPFAWGASDCCLFAADAVAAMTGIDPIAEHRGRYRTRLGALRLLNQQNGLEGWLSAILGTAIRASLAQRGDVVLLPGTAETGPAAGICTGEHAIGQGILRPEYLPMPLDGLAWRVG